MTICIKDIKKISLQYACVMRKALEILYLKLNKINYTRYNTHLHFKKKLNYPLFKKSTFPLNN